MPRATDFFKAGFITAASLEPDVRYRATVIDAGPHKFENGETKLAIRLDYLGKSLIMNDTRGGVMLLNFWDDYDNWIGKQITFYQGDTLYLGKPAKSVVIEAIAIDQIAAQPAKRPAIGQHPVSNPKPDITSGRGAWDDAAPPPTTYDGPDDDIPFE
jgi:hypothetical protein